MQKLETNITGRMMVQYRVIVDGEVLHQLFVRDDGLARLLEGVLNEVLEAQATERI